MPADPAALRLALQQFDFARLFNELGWDRFGETVEVAADGKVYRLRGVAQKRGMAVFALPGNESLPDRSLRLRIERGVAKLHHEHILIYSDAGREKQVWQWVKREHGRPLACREHLWSKGQSGEALVQRLLPFAFELDEEDELSLMAVTTRVARGLDVDRVTKRFYERFEREHEAFLKFIEGISQAAEREWYASLMLNRLMFVYFIQKKRFLDGDENYLPNRLARVQAERGRGRFHTFYRHFLLRLFHEGLGKHPDERSRELDALLGRVPYLNGGLFDVHEIETAYPEIHIPDEAFEAVFGFFDAYSWHLDDRPLRSDREINPDVLGYIFEKYVNQKEMGAYYTKEDITEYIAKNTLLPFLLEKTRSKCRIAFEGEASVWRLLSSNADRYIYEPVRRGVIDEHGKIIPESALPDFVRTGMHDAKARMFDKRYNLGAADLKDAQGWSLTLPTETWREYIERRSRCLALRERLSRGEVREVADLITLNLDIRQFVQDAIETAEGTDLLRAFWHAIVGRAPERSNQDFEHGVTVLDPTCGSGAFLFAVLNILEELYEASLERMRGFVADAEAKGSVKSGSSIAFFRDVLAEVDRHPNQKYYVYKTIILNNLFGVDIMPEAVEIAKLRLFLKLVSQVDIVEQLEPLPDIDFNLRAGNTLVGFATLDEARRVVKGEGGAKGMNLPFTDALDAIEEKARDVDRLFLRFREAQVKHGARVSHKQKQALRDRLKALEDELNVYLAGEYGVDPRKEKAYKRWLECHRPFHWFVDFYGIMKVGGFDIIIGNPPFVEYRKVRQRYTARNLATASCENLYAFVLERSILLLSSRGFIGLIFPIAISSVAETRSARELLLGAYKSIWVSNYAIRPAKLFEGVEQRLSILLATSSVARRGAFSSKFYQWYVPERETLFRRIEYCSADEHFSGSYFGKIGNPKAHSVLRRIRSLKGKSQIADLLQRSGSSLLYFHRTPGYWIRVMDFEPYFRSPTSSRSVHHIRELHLANVRDATFVGGVLSSSLYFLWFFAVGNCRNLTLDDVKSFPLPPTDDSDARKLSRLFSELMDDYQRNSEVKSRGDTEFQEFRWALSKPIIDRLDQGVGVLYGLDVDEIDHVINYDLKIRMSDEGAIPDEGIE